LGFTSVKVVRETLVKLTPVDVPVDWPHIFGPVVYTGFVIAEPEI